MKKDFLDGNEAANEPIKNKGHYEIISPTLDVTTGPRMKDVENNGKKTSSNLKYCYGSINNNEKLSFSTISIDQNDDVKHEENPFLSGVTFAGMCKYYIDDNRIVKILSFIDLTHTNTHIYI